MRTVTVNVTFELMTGVAVLTVFVTVISASGTLTVAEAALLATTGSYVDDEAVAVLVIAVWVVTVATIVSVADAPLARLPTSQLPAL